MVHVPDPNNTVTILKNCLTVIPFHSTHFTITTRDFATSSVPNCVTTGRFQDDHTSSRERAIWIADDFGEHSITFNMT